MMTTSCSGTSGPSSGSSNGPPLGDTDSAVLADVMAFLDDFDDDGDRDAWLADTPVSPTAVSVVIDSVTPSRSTSKRSEGLDSSSHRPRPYSAAKNKARVNRYWKRKEELQVLRSQVVSLNGHLDLLQQCARSPMEIEVTSALGITIRSAYRSAVGKMDWKHRAAQEEQLRYHSERINAQLRQLLIFQRQWTRELGVCLQSGSGAPIKIEPNSRSDGERLDDRISILRCVYEEARMLANLGAVLPMAPSTSLPETKLKSPIEWTTSFSIPVSDPRRVGKMWWDSFHKMVGTLEAGTVSLKYHAGDVPRLEKSSKWVVDDNNEQVQFRGTTMFEIHDEEAQWILAVTSNVFNGTGKLLFRTTSSVIVMQQHASSSRACIFRAHYRVHDIACEKWNSPTIGPSNSSCALAIGVWRSKMHRKDHRMQRIFLES